MQPASNDACHFRAGCAAVSSVSGGHAICCRRMPRRAEVSPDVFYQCRLYGRGSLSAVGASSTSAALSSEDHFRPCGPSARPLAECRLRISRTSRDGEGGSIERPVNSPKPRAKATSGALFENPLSSHGLRVSSRLLLGGRVAPSANDQTVHPQRRRCFRSPCLPSSSPRSDTDIRSGRRGSGDRVSP